MCYLGEGVDEVSGSYLGKGVDEVDDDAHGVHREHHAHHTFPRPCCCCGLFLHLSGRSQAWVRTGLQDTSSSM